MLFVLPYQAENPLLVLCGSDPGTDLRRPRAAMCLEAEGGLRRLPVPRPAPAN